MNVTPHISEGFALGFGPAGGGEALRLEVPALGCGAKAETLWGGARPGGSREGFGLFEEGDWLLGVARVAVVDALDHHTEETYRALFAVVRAAGRQVARIWNYVPEINADAPEGLENYRVFCRGRARACDAEAGALPAASAVGGEPGWLVVVFAAARGNPQNKENPEQVPAYEYPLDYGPRAPSFSRAAQVEANGRRWTFISGTAAIKGHATVSADSLEGQIDCTLDNLRLISGACGLGARLGEADVGASQTMPARKAEGEGEVERHFKVYLRRAEDLDVVRAVLEARLLRPADRVAWLACAICRAELQIEIEVTVIDLPGPGGGSVTG